MTTSQIVDNNSPLGWTLFRKYFKIRTTLIHYILLFIPLFLSLSLSSSHINNHKNSNFDHFFKFLGSFLRGQLGNAGWPKSFFLHNVSKHFGKFWCTFPKFLLTPKGASLGFNKYLNFCAKNHYEKKITKKRSSAFQKFLIFLAVHGRISSAWHPIYEIIFNSITLFFIWLCFYLLIFFVY